MKIQHTLALTLPVMSGWAVGAELGVKFSLPQLNVAEYHRPYVAMWLERADQSAVNTLAVLYDVKKKDDAGLKWVKDMRQWWRKAGRDLKLPADGVSGATRAPGEHVLTFGAALNQLDKLPAGDYALAVEVAREAGGREVVRLPVKLPLKGKQSASVNGKEEVGTVAITVTP
jgi:hypothetical protein